MQNINKVKLQHFAGGFRFFQAYKSENSQIVGAAVYYRRRAGDTLQGAQTVCPLFFYFAAAAAAAPKHFFFTRILSSALQKEFQEPQYFFGLLACVPLYQFNCS